MEKPLSISGYEFEERLFSSFFQQELYLKKRRFLGGYSIFSASGKGIGTLRKLGRLVYDIETIPEFSEQTELAAGLIEKLIPESKIEVWESVSIKCLISKIFSLVIKKGIGKH